MLSIQTNLKRKIELLGYALDNPDALRDADFALLFERDIPTIKRDMQELRNEGIDIHSEKKKGVCLRTEIDPQLLQKLVVQYMGICASEGGIDRATRLMVKKLKGKALSILVRLQQCIEQKRIVRIDYQKDAKQQEFDREIKPLIIFSSEGYWRVLAQHEGKTKQYHLNKLLDVRPTERTFKPPSHEQIEALFRNSFKSWIGTERHQIKLRLDRTWTQRMRPQQLMETQVITENPDGSVILEATVNSLTEIASWVVSRGSGVVVLDPPELRQMVINTAQGVLNNYR
jgi:predicted DNA-binding transcriptional regulator YafY